MKEKAHPSLVGFGGNYPKNRRRRRTTLIEINDYEPQAPTSRQVRTVMSDSEGEG